MHAFDATAQLQSLLNSSSSNGIVTITNESMGADPCHGSTKFFGAVVDRDGLPLYFAAQEGQTIDFFHSQDVAEVKAGAASKSAR